MIKKLKVLDLFSGIGGFSLGLESTGHFETIAFVENDEYCQAVLKHHFPEVPILGDIKNVTKETTRTTPDVICGGFPCQPYSVAGDQRAKDDPRHLWPEMFRLIKELRPTWVIGENVAGHIKLGLDTVLENLESEGYSTRTFSISAASVGANHKRERIWIIANKNVEDSRSRGGWIQSTGDQEGIRSGTFEEEFWSSNTDTTSGSSEGTETMADTKSSYRDEHEIDREHGKTETQEVFGNRDGISRGSSWWEVEPDVGRVADGLPDTMDRLKSLGNSLVPQIPYYIALSILEAERNG